MKLFVIPNLLSTKQVDTTISVLKTLSNTLGHDVSIFKEDSIKVNGNEELFNFDIKDSDYLISLGGDACFFKAAKFALIYNKPVLGVNSGHVGYLCATNLNDIEKLSEDYIKSLRINERSVLSVLYKNKEYIAFNDIVLGKSNFGKIITIEYRINNLEPVVFKGDGVIVCTSLGSTGYSYSAGGEKILEEQNKIGLTPICPSFKSCKPQLIENDAIISVNSPSSYENNTGFFIDGCFIEELKEMITIKMSDKKLLFVKGC